MTPEKKVQNEILKYLDKLEKDGYKVFHQRRQAGGFNYKKGIPDIYCVVNGKHIEIEVKKPGGKLSTMQEKFRDKCELLNIKWMVVDDISELKEYMQEVLNEI